MMDDTESMPPAKFLATQAFDLGRKRQDQTDLCVQFPELGIYCVIDDHGCTFQGTPAANLVADVLQKALAPQPADSTATATPPAVAIRHALEIAHFRLRQESEFLAQDPKICSFVAVLLHPDRPDQTELLQAGSCRLYRLREIRLGEFRLDLLSNDHSDPAGAEFESQLRMAVEASSRPALTHGIGQGETLGLEEKRIEVRETDLLLLCSDGLSRMFPDHLIARVLARRRQKSMESLAQTLIAEANAAGGKDNISVILLGAEELPASIPSTPEPSALPPSIATPEPVVEAGSTDEALAEPMSPVTQPAPLPPRAGDDVTTVGAGLTEAEAPNSQRRSQWLPLFILFVMIVSSAWILWGGRSKSPAPASDTPVAAVETAKAQDRTPLPESIPSTSTLTGKENAVPLPSIAASAREPAASESKTHNGTEVPSNPITQAPEPKKAETKSPDLKSADPKPLDDKPQEISLAREKTIDATPGESKPVTVGAPELKPPEVRAPETTPPAPKPPEIEPSETKPGEAKSAAEALRIEESKTVPPKPDLIKPVEGNKSLETKATEAQRIETTPETKPTETKPIDDKPIEAKPKELKPTESKAEIGLSLDKGALGPVALTQPPAPSKPVVHVAVPDEKPAPQSALPSPPPSTIVLTPPPSASPSVPVTIPTPRSTLNQSSDRANLPRELSRTERLVVDYEILLVRSGLLPPTDREIRSNEGRQTLPGNLESLSRTEQRHIYNEARRLERELEDVRALDALKRRHLRALRERFGAR